MNDKKDQIPFYSTGFFEGLVKRELDKRNNWFKNEEDFENFFKNTLEEFVISKIEKKYYKRKIGTEMPEDMNFIVKKQVNTNKKIWIDSKIADLVVYNNEWFPI